MKFNIKRIVSFVLVLVMLTGMLSVTVFAAEPAAQAVPTVDIISKNVMYGERYYLMFAVDAQNVPEGCSVELVATKGGEASNVTKRENEVVNGVDAHVFAVNKGVAAQDIDVLYTAKAQIKDADGNVVAESATYIYSVLEYLNERLYVSTGVDAKEIKLYQTFLTFAKASEAALTPNNASINNSVYVVFPEGTLDGTNKGGMYKAGDVITGLTYDGAADEGFELYYTIDVYNANGALVSSEDIKIDEFESYTVTANRAVISIDQKEAGATEPEIVTANLSFASTANRLSQTSSQQVWQQNGITLTNDKAASSTAVGNYSNPARFYASSKITIECAGMTQIVFNCNSSSYATSLKNSIGADATVSGSKVTVTFADPVDSYVIAKLTAQVRVNSIDVTYEK